MALIDLGIPSVPGNKVATDMQHRDPELVTVLITGWKLGEGDPRLSAFHFRIQKPLQDIQRVQDIVAQAVDLHDIRAGGGI